MVEDEYGRDPGLRYLHSELILFPLTMLSKRVERGADVDVHVMFYTISSDTLSLEDWRARHLPAQNQLGVGIYINMLV